MYIIGKLYIISINIIENYNRMGKSCHKIIIIHFENETILEKI